MGPFGVPKIRALFEATYIVGLRKAGMAEERASHAPGLRRRQRVRSAETFMRISRRGDPAMVCPFQNSTAWTVEMSGYGTEEMID